MCKTFSLLDILFTQVEHLKGIIIKLAQCKILVNIGIYNIKIVCNKTALKNIILNAVTVSSTAGYSVYKSRLK